MSDSENNLQNINVTEDIDIVSESSSQFDGIIGFIEDIIIGDDFQKIMKEFQEKHWEQFNVDEENSLICYEIFHQYIQTLENFLETTLKQKVEDFSMVQFTSQLKMLEPDLKGEVFEVLLTITDFLSFKEMMLEYRSDKEGKSIRIDDIITVRACKNPDEL